MVRALLGRAQEDPNAILHIPAGVLAQAYRDPRRQVRLTRLLKAPNTRIVQLDAELGLAAGIILGLRGCSDAIDASVVICARLHKQGVVTSDPDDLRRLAPDLKLMVV